MLSPSEVFPSRAQRDSTMQENSRTKGNCLVIQILRHFGEN